MSNKLKKDKQPSHEIHQQSVFREAWDNMSEDFSRFMPSFFTKKFKNSRYKIWIVLFITLAELLVLGVIGKLAYDWLIK